MLLDARVREKEVCPAPDHHNHVDWFAGAPTRRQVLALDCMALKHWAALARKEGFSEALQTRGVLPTSRRPGATTPTPS